MDNYLPNRYIIDDLIEKIWKILNEHQILIYGGNAIDHYLNRNLYSEEDFPDIDIFYSDPLLFEEIMNLEPLPDPNKNKKYNYTSRLISGMAFDQKTKKIFYKYIPILDLKLISYERMKKLYKHRDDIYIPISEVIRNLCNAMSKPVDNFYRLDKDYTRFKMLMEDQKLLIKKYNPDAICKLYDNFIESIKKNDVFNKSPDEYIIKGINSFIKKDMNDGFIYGYIIYKGYNIGILPLLIEHDPNNKILLTEFYHNQNIEKMIISN